MAKILVTGATGFVGQWLVRSLAQQGHQIRVLVRPQSDVSEFSDLRLDYTGGDVTDLTSVKNALEGCEVVFHLAGFVGYSRAQREIMQQVNVEGTRNVLTAIKSHPIQRFIHTSSVVAVGASFDGRRPLNEKDPYNLAHLNLGYFETKHQAEQLVLQAVQNENLDAVMVNPATIYGAGDAKKGSRKTQLKVAQGRFPFYTSGGVNVIAIEDVIEGFLQAWKVGKKGERYILGGENIKIFELFEIIASCAGVKTPSIYLPNALVHLLGKAGDGMERLGQKGPLNSETAWTSTLFHWFDNTKARLELGLNPRSASRAIEQSVRWIKENGWLNT